jgi:hypothetical protein
MKGFPLLEAQAILFEKRFWLSKGTKGLKVVQKSTMKEVQLFKRGLKRGFKAGKSD